MDIDKAKFEKAKLIDLNSAEAERLKFIYVWENKGDPEAIEAAEAAWNRTTLQPYLKGFRMILDAALESEWFDLNSKPRAQDDYLMLGQIARLGKHDAAPMLSELMGGELELWSVIERVDTIKKPKARVKQVKHCPHCGGEL